VAAATAFANAYLPLCQVEPVKAIVVKGLPTFESVVELLRGDNTILDALIWVPPPAAKYYRTPAPE
jgi:hypothetical protein